MNVELPDGTILEDIPDGTTREQLRTKLKANGYDVSKLGTEEATPLGNEGRRSLPKSTEKPETDNRKFFKALLGDGLGSVAGDVGAGIGKAVSGAVNLTEDIIPPYALAKSLRGRRSPIAESLQEYTDPAYKEGGGTAKVANFAGEMALTGGPATKAAEGVMGLVKGSGGLSKALRAAAGAGTAGAVSGAMVEPGEGETRLENAKQGAAFGVALSPAVKLATSGGRGLKRALSGGQMEPEVRALADRATQLGIDIPADRLVNSKPLNALAASLDYVPFSGRTATVNKMEDQLNTALSKTFGQNSSNVTQSLRRAQGELGSKFDTVLQNNTVKMDEKFLEDLADASNMAAKELGSDGARVIQNQVDEIMAKAATGNIDGQAAYNIKRTLDRIGNRNSPESFYARDLKQKLMGALDRSLGPQQAADFAQVRKQYGNMLALENIAQNGGEGGVSIARLANMKNINNPELQELADISAQFVKSREGAHGAAQRVGAGALTLGLTGPLGVAAGVASGRGINKLLNSSAIRNSITANTSPAEEAEALARILRNSGAAAGATANDF